MVNCHGADLAGAARRADLHEEFAINCAKLFPLRRNVILVVDRLDWADRLTCAAIHALIRLNVEHAITLVDAIYWALFDA